MCKAPLHDFLVALPKNEFHLHLEGTLEPSLLFQLSKENNIKLPCADEDPAFASVQTLLERYKNFTSLDDFLHYYFIAMSTLTKASDFEALAWEYLVRAKKENVVHAEVFFDPQAHLERGVEYATIMDGFTTACRRAQADLNITTELIACFLRHLPCSSAEETYQTTLPDLRSGRISGIGLSSSEKGNPPHLFKSIYESAEREGIRRTAHAGEEADVSYMRDALESLHIQRADHGIKLPEDPKLMAEFATRQIMVTICPLSNLRLQCVQDLRQLPIRTYLDQGVVFSINSDDPAYFGGYIQANYCAVQEAFNLTLKEWSTIVTGSIRSGWCSNERKTEMMGYLDSVMRRFA